MTTAIVSDLHLGAWQLNDLLRYPVFIDRFARDMRDVDELVLLGDIFELRFQRLEDALAIASPCLAAVGDALRFKRGRGRPSPRVVFVPGNHDYHLALQIMELEQERAIERGNPERYHFDGRLRAPSDAFVVRQMRRMLGPDIEVELAYSYVTLETVQGPLLAMHGHYLDLHLPSPAERLLALVQQALTAYRLNALPPGFELYEAVLRPQNELLYWIAQSPAGAEVQSELWRRLRGDSRQMRRGFVARLRRMAARRAVRAAEALAGAAAHQLTQRILKGDVTLVSPARGTPVDDGIHAFMESLVALQEDLFLAEHWTTPPPYVVFGHTHRPGPLPGVDATELWRKQWAGQTVQVFNSGSWLYDVERALTEEYHQSQWPGTYVLIPDGEEPRLVSLLKDLSADDVEHLIDLSGVIPERG
jgi:hypothetical protein